MRNLNFIQNQIPCRRALAFCLCLGLVWLASPVRAVEAPSGFEAETLLEDLQAVTAMTFAPDGRLFFAEQTGALRVYKDGRLLPRPALDLSDRVDDYWERGLIGLALHSDFPRTPHLFVVYVAKSPYTRHVVSRFTLVGDFADPSSERVLLEGDDQSTLGGGVPAGHQGGPIVFGPDGKLYIAIGEQTAGKPSQSLNTFQGKILRINPDGSIPEDNPFYEKTTGKYRAIWSFGQRNPYGLVFQPGTDRLFSTEVGSSAFEEVNVIVKGGNYGWPHAEGYSDNPDFVNPIHAYPPTVGGSICGGVFYPESAGDDAAVLFPEKWRGKLFFVDWRDNWIKALDPDRPKELLDFAEGLDKPVWIEVAPDGSLYVLNRGTIWRDGKKFEANSGSLIRIRYTGRETSREIAGVSEIEIPPTLSETGLFKSLQPLAPKAPLTAFEIALPPHRPGVRGRYWISVPNGESIQRREDGQWEFPEGAVVAQHYLLEGQANAPFETHVFWMTGGRSARAAAYRWNQNGGEAALVENTEIVDLPGSERLWMSPGFERNLDLDALITGFLLPVSTQQMNRNRLDDAARSTVNQLVALSEMGWLKPEISKQQLDGIPRLVPLGDSKASLALRVRSYLDVNCSQCHRPGGLSRGRFDARIVTPLADQGLIQGEVLTDPLGIENAKIIRPGEPERSVLFQRLNRADFLRMPPIVLNDEPHPLLPVLKQWIERMPIRAQAASGIESRRTR